MGEMVIQILEMEMVVIMMVMEMMVLMMGLMVEAGVVLCDEVEGLCRVDIPDLVTVL